MKDANEEMNDIYEQMGHFQHKDGKPKEEPNAIERLKTFLVRTKFFNSVISRPDKGMVRLRTLK